MKLITGSLGALALTLATAGIAQTAPDPGQVQIQSVAYAGSGCPAGSSSSNLSADAQAFTLLFSAFTAAAGPGVDAASSHKNCEISLALSYPSGFTFAFVGVDYRGYAALDPNVVGTQRSTYFFESHLASPPLQSVYQGPIDTDYQSHSDINASTLVWAPCGATRTLTINSELTINAANGGKGLMTIDSLDGVVKHTYSLVWRHCIPTPPNVSYRCSPCSHGRQLCGDWDATNHLWVDQAVVSCTVVPTPPLPPVISYRCSPCTQSRQVCGDWDGANHVWVDQTSEGCTM